MASTSLPSAAASLVSSATETPTAALSEIVIAVMAASCESAPSAPEMFDAVSTIANPPAILSSAAWSASKVETETVTVPPVAAIEAICATSASSVERPATIFGCGIGDRKLIGRAVGVGELADRRRVVRQLSDRDAYRAVVGDRDRVNVGVVELPEVSGDRRRYVQNPKSADLIVGGNIVQIFRDRHRVWQRYDLSTFAGRLFQGVGYRHSEIRSRQLSRRA